MVERVDYVGGCVVGGLFTPVFQESSAVSQPLFKHDGTDLTPIAEFVLEFSRVFLTPGIDERT